MVAVNMMRLGIGGLLIASTPINGSPLNWAEWGLAGLVISYTLWRDWHREQRMSEERKQHETWVRDKLLSALERNTVALDKITQEDE